MSNSINIEDRRKRMQSLFENLDCPQDKNLIKVGPIDHKSFNNLKNAVMYYFWDCITSSYEEINIKINDNFYAEIKAQKHVIP